MSCNCEGCPIDGQYTPVESVGPLDAPYVVVTDIPKPADAKAGRVLSPVQMSVFAKALTTYGFGRDDFQFIPVARCPFDPDTLPAKERRAVMQACRKNLHEDILAYDRDMVIPLGAVAASGAFGRNIKITEVRGMPNESAELGTKIFPLLSPGIVVKYPQNQPLFDADVASLARYIDSGMDIAAASGTYGTYKIIEDLEELIDLDPELVCFDMEATSLRWYQKGCDVRTYDPAIHKGLESFRPRAQILTMQFSINEGESYVLVWDHPERPVDESLKPKLRNQLRRLLCAEGRRVVGHNIKFDNVYLWATEGIRFRIGGDSLMLCTLDDENAQQKNLDVMVKIHVPDMAGYADHFNATVDKSRMWEVPLDRLVEYGGGDTDAGLRLHNVLEERIAADDGQWAHYTNVSIPGLNALAGLEIRGQCVDTEEALPKFQEFMTEEVNKEYASLIAAVPKVIKREHIERMGGDATKALSFSRGDFVRDVLFDHPAGFRLKPKLMTKSTQKLDKGLQKASTSTKDHLPYFFEECPFTVELAAYIKDKRLLDTNIIGFNKKYVQDGYVRPIYSLTKAVTGRTACVHEDTPVVTKRGIVLAADVVVGDLVFTHKGRWRPVTKLFLKPETQMYALHLSNGEVLTVTAHHQLLLDSGHWADTGWVLEEFGYAISEQGAYAEPEASSFGSYDLPQGASNRWGASGAVRGQPRYGSGYDSRAYDGRGVQYPEGHPIPKVEARGEEPAARAAMGVRLRGWAGVFDAVGGRETVLRASDSDGRVPRLAPVAATGLGGSAPYRREPEEQLSGQPMLGDTGGASGGSRPLPESGGGLTVEKVICAGVHRVYDFEVAEDHSYLACGVFNHNSEDPNGQNFPKRGARAKAYRSIFVPPPGYYVAELDLSQAELRISASMSGDKTMISIYQAGGDIHRATALIVMGVTEEQFDKLPKSEQKDARTKAKAVNFGLK